MLARMRLTVIVIRILKVERSDAEKYIAAMGDDEVNTLEVDVTLTLTLALALTLTLTPSLILTQIGC